MSWGVKVCFAEGSKRQAFLRFSSETDCDFMVPNFFNLGFNNRWKKILPIELQIKLNQYFKKDLKYLNYIQ